MLFIPLHFNFAQIPFFFPFYTHVIHGAIVVCQFYVKEISNYKLCFENTQRNVLKHSKCEPVSWKFKKITQEMKQGSKL